MSLYVSLSLSLSLPLPPQTSVQGKEYMLEQRRAYCKPCAEVAFLTKCVICEKAVEVPQHGEQVRHIRTAVGVYHENW